MTEADTDVLIEALGCPLQQLNPMLGYQLAMGSANNHKPW